MYLISKCSQSQDYHEDGDRSRQTDAQIIFFGIDGSLVYSVETLGDECGQLLENTSTEYDHTRNY